MNALIIYILYKHKQVYKQEAVFYAIITPK